jgi:quinol monooxygenase YgiN
VYDDRAAFEAHLKTPHFLACKPKLDAWLGTNKVRFLSRVDP